MAYKHYQKIGLHNVPLMAGMFLSLFALFLTIPATMIGLSQNQDVSSSAKETSQIITVNGVSGFPQWGDDGLCKICPPNAASVRCIMVNSNWCNITQTPTPSIHPGGGLIKINDSDSRISYSGSWTRVSGGGGSTAAYKGDYHMSPSEMSAATTTSPQGTARLTFQGDKVGVTLLTWINRGIADIYIDGQLVSSLNGYFGQIVPKTWTSDSLSCGMHTVEVKHTGRTTAPKGGTMVLLDYFSVSPCSSGTATPTRIPTLTPTAIPGSSSSKVNDNSSDIQYTGSWAYENGGGGSSIAYKNDYHLSPSSPSNVTSSTPQGSLKYTFTGTKIAATFLTWINRGIADIYLDGQFIGSLDGYYGQIVPKTWTSNSLSCGQHSIEIKHTGKTTAPRGGRYVVFDYFTVTGCSNSSATPTTTLVQQADSKLTFSPSALNLLSGQVFSTDLILNTGVNQATAIDLVLTFNPSKINVTEVIPANSFTQILATPKIDNSNGKVNVTLGVQVNKAVRGSNIKVLTLKAKAFSSNATITVDSASKISAINNLGNVLVSSTPFTAAVATPVKKTGDVNGDGKVDLSDITIIVTNFNQSNCGNIADLDGNCRVNIYDYNIITQNFER